MIKTMKRWSWNIFCALSLLISATSVTLWVRSYLSWDQIYHQSDTTNRWPEDKFNDKTLTWAVGWERGKLVMLRDAEYHAGIGGGALAKGWQFGTSNTQGEVLWNDLFANRMDLHFAGLQFRLFVGKEGWIASSTTIVTLPLWLFLIFAVPPLLWLRGRRKLGGRGFAVEVPEEMEKTDMNAKAPSRQEKN